MVAFYQHEFCLKIIFINFTSFCFIFMKCTFLLILCNCYAHMTVARLCCICESLIIQRK